MKLTNGYEIIICYLHIKTDGSTGITGPYSYKNNIIFTNQEM